MSKATAVSFVGALEHRPRRRIDEVHVIHIGGEAHRFARAGGAARIDAPADFLAIDLEEYDRLHAHRLHDIERGRELGDALAGAAPRLGDVLGPQPEYQLLAAQALVARHMR